MFRYGKKKGFFFFLQLEGNHVTLLEVVGGKEEKKHVIKILKETNLKANEQPNAMHNLDSSPQGNQISQTTFK